MKRYFLGAALLSSFAANTSLAQEPLFPRKTAVISPAKAVPVTPKVKDSTTPAYLPQAAPAAKPAADKPVAPPTTPKADLAPATSIPTSCTGIDYAADPMMEEQNLFWFNADYLLWWVKGNNVPPLVSGSPNGTPQTNAGVLGTPGANVLLGGNDINGTFRHGFRFRAGMWLTDDGQGFDLGYFRLATVNKSRSYGSANGSNIVSRPFVDATNGLNAAQLVSFPGVVTGFVTVDSSSSLQGGEANYATLLNSCDPCDRMKFFVGYRVINLEESINITENLTSVGANRPVPPGTRIVVNDQFRTQNTFHGVHFGFDREVRTGDNFFNIRPSIGFGGIHRNYSVAGSTLLNVPVAGGGTTTVLRPGGLLAQPTNIRNESDSKFAYTFEMNATLGRYVTDNIRVGLGYSFLYLSNVIRPGGLIDPVVDPRLLNGGTVAGATRPAPIANSTNFWAHGITLSLNYKY